MIRQNQPTPPLDAAPLTVIPAAATGAILPSNVTAPFDYLRVNSSCQHCFPDGTCRGFFGLGTTTISQGHTHSIVCQTFDDGYANPIFYNNALSIECPARRYSPGGGTAPGDYRKWWGRCSIL